MSVLLKYSRIYSSFKNNSLLKSINQTRRLSTVRNNFKKIISTSNIPTFSQNINLNSKMNQYTTNSSTHQQQNGNKIEFKRLPTNVQPLNYSLTLEPNLETFIFEGEAKIDIKISSPTDRIILNSAELNFDTAHFSPSTSPSTKVTTNQIEFQPQTETAHLIFPNELKSGYGTLFIKFKGHLNDKLKGFYRTKYTNQNGDVCYAATTQLAAADARRAFPCWDEPAIKATFDVTLIADKNKTVLSNMVTLI
jgi:aminopeptidase N